MKKTITILIIALLLTNTAIFAQATFEEYKAGHVFYISLPDYMSKTAGLNNAAIIQFKNVIKDVAGFVIEDNKEELKLAEINYTSINEYYEDIIKDFAKDVEKRAVSEPKSKKIGETNFVETDVTYHDKDANIDIYYFIGLAETATAYYKVFCWGTLENKDKYKADFQKTLYSLKD